MFLAKLLFTFIIIHLPMEMNPIKMFYSLHLATQATSPKTSPSAFAIDSLEYAEKVQP